MKNRDDIPTVRVEVIPPGGQRESAKPRPTTAEAEKMLRQLVERQVAEVLERREDFLFQPFFVAKKVADAIKRLQTVPEQRAWAVVFAKYGCIVCERKNAVHVGCGCCGTCHGRIYRRKCAAIKAVEKDGRDYSSEPDERELVLQAFAPLPMKALPPATTRKRAKRSR